MTGVYQNGNVKSPVCVLLVLVKWKSNFENNSKVNSQAERSSHLCTIKSEHSGRAGVHVC